MIVYGESDDETVKLTSRATGMSEVDVRFMLAVGRGESSGDIVTVDERPRGATPRRDLNRQTRRHSRRSVPAV